MRSTRVAVAVVLLTIAIGVCLWQVGGPNGNYGENAWAAAPDGREDGMAPPCREHACPTTKLRVEVKSNDPCYVCHMPFLKESLATAHAKKKVWCGTCHGPSIAHIEDEHIGATPPDVVFKKDQIDRMCGECHDRKKHPELTKKTRSKRLAEGRKAQREIKGRRVKVTGVCTDCHGRHWIPSRDRQGSGNQAGVLFDGNEARWSAQ